MNGDLAQGGQRRRFLFLQGPHGPFFAQLARSLRAAGAGVERIGFAGGDRIFWRGLPYRRFQGTAEAWPEEIAAGIRRNAITDLVLYGEHRPMHRAAIAAAREAGLTLHLLEEGHLRPWWITYERGAVRLDAIPVARMQLADRARTHAPDRWGDLPQHVFWSALSHGASWAGRPPSVPPHRGEPLGREFRRAFVRLATLPARAAWRRAGTRRLLRSGVPYTLVLLQLDHDLAYRAACPFGSVRDLATHVVETFARTAAPHHHLVFKDHPLDDGRAGQSGAIRTAARRLGMAGRAHHLAGGRLAEVLDPARAVVTVSSTAAQQALWRGLPVKALGPAIYARPGLASEQSLEEFLRDPDPPDRETYDAFRAFLLETSQVRGGFYAAAARAEALRRLPDLMLDAADPYSRAHAPGAARPQHLRVLPRSA